MKDQDRKDFVTYVMSEVFLSIASTVIVYVIVQGFKKRFAK